MAVENGKSDKREVVFQAAARLFMANGYMSTTMDDVAAAVSLNKGTLYYYYQGKAAILFDIVYRLEEGRLAIARGKPFNRDSGSILGALREFVHDTAVHILDNPVSSRIGVQEAPFLDMWLNDEQISMLHACHDEYYAYLITMIEEGVASGELNPGHPTVLAQGITGALSSLARWFRGNGPLSKAEVAAQLTDMLINGLVSAKKTDALPAVRISTAKKRSTADITDAGSVAKTRVKPTRRVKSSARRARAAAIHRDLT